MKKLNVLVAVLLTFVFDAARAHDKSHWSIRPLVRGAAIQSTNGIAVGPDGNLYVATVFGREIAVVDHRSGAVLARLGPDVGVESPDDLTFGPDGALYWTSPFTGEVGRLSSDGEISTVAKLPLGVNPIAFNSQGRLFVAAVIFNDMLYEIDPEGVAPPRLILEGAGNLNGFAFGPDGMLYSPQASTRSVLRINVDATSVEDAASIAASEFTFPAAVDFDSYGRLYVNDAGAGKIVRIDLATGVREDFATLPTGVDNITFDEDDNLYATSLLDGSITEIRPNGHKRLIHRGGMILPGGLTMLTADRFGRREELWVADLFTLKAYDSTSGRLRRIERVIPLTSVLVSPATVAADGDRLIVTSWLGNAVQVFDVTSNSVVVSIRDFATPLNAIAFQGDLVVAELRTGSVVRTPMAQPAPRTVLATGLLAPAGLAAVDDNLWATDNLAGTLLQLVAEGQVLTPPRLVASKLARPEGLATLSDGSLVVVESGAGRVSRVKPETGAVSTIAAGIEFGPPPPNVPPTWLFNGVTVDADDQIYVSSDETNVVYKLKRRR
jgi:sugar lactone lactonase YvrE